MNTDVKPKKMDVEEANDDNAEQALCEYRAGGHTNRRCLRCGGKYRFEITPSAYRITCENGDFSLTVRGI